MIPKEALQVMKSRYDESSNISTCVKMEVNELIAAYEQVQAELTEANDLYEIAEEGRVHFMDKLAEAQAKLGGCKSLATLERENLLERNIDLISERKKYQAEGKKLKTQLADAQSDLVNATGVAANRLCHIKSLEREVKELSAENKRLARLIGAGDVDTREAKSIW